MQYFIGNPDEIPLQMYHYFLFYANHIQAVPYPFKRALSSEIADRILNSVDRESLIPRLVLMADDSDG